MSKGCTISLIVVLAVIVIIVLGVFLFWDKIKQAGIDTMITGVETGLKENLPEGYSEEYVTELISEFRTAVHEDRIASDKLQGLITNLQAAMDDKQIDVDESKLMINLIEDALGKEPLVIEEMIDEEMPDDSLAVPDSL